MAEGFGIGELSRLGQCKVPTIRYYEAVGLMPRPARSAGGQRRYGPAALARLRFIQRCRRLGFAQGAIRELLELQGQPGEDCDGVMAIARAHVGEIEQRIAQLDALREELRRLLDACAGGRIGDCRLIEQLAAGAAPQGTGEKPRP